MQPAAKSGARCRLGVTIAPVTNLTRARRSPALARWLARNARRRAARLLPAARPIRVAGAGAAVSARAQKARRPRVRRKRSRVTVKELPRTAVALRRATDPQPRFSVPVPVSLLARRSIHLRDR